MSQSAFGADSYFGNIVTSEVTGFVKPKRKTIVKKKAAAKKKAPVKRKTAVKKKTATKKKTVAKKKPTIVLSPLTKKTINIICKVKSCPRISSSISKDIEAELEIVAASYDFYGFKRRDFFKQSFYAEECTTYFSSPYYKKKALLNTSASTILTILTPDILISKRNLGRFYIGITPGLCYPLIQHETKGRGRSVHPHINYEGIPCLGGTSIEITRAAREYRFIDFFDLMNAYLSGYNARDSYHSLSQYSKIGGLPCTDCGTRIPRRIRCKSCRNLFCRSCIYLTAKKVLCTGCHEKQRKTKEKSKTSLNS